MRQVYVPSAMIALLLRCRSLITLSPWLLFNVLRDCLCFQSCCLNCQQNTDTSTLIGHLQTHTCRYTNQCTDRKQSFPKALLIVSFSPNWVLFAKTFTYFSHNWNWWQNILQCNTHTDAYIFETLWKLTFTHSEVPKKHFSLLCLWVFCMYQLFIL